MRRVLPPILAAVAVLGAAGAGARAASSETARVTICGQHGACATVDDAEVRLDAAAAVAAPPPEPYYIATFARPGGETGGLLLYFPASNVLGANGWAPGTMAWLPVSDPTTAEAMRAAVRDIEPHRAVSAWPNGIKSPYRLPPAPPVAGRR